MRSLSKSVFVLLSIAATAISVSAQNHPMPGAQSDPPVICTGCPGYNMVGEPNAGKPTSPYDSPIKLHAGRTVDSSDTKTVQNLGMRTVRAGSVRVAPAGNRIYLGLGATIGAYTLDTFFSDKLQQPMVAVNTIPTGNPYGGRTIFEKLARPDRFFYPEATGTGWTTPLVDNNTVLLDFDADDRGLVYLGTRNFGWGIVSDPGGTDGSLLPSVKQVYPSSRVQRLISLRSGSSYYVYTTNGNDEATLFDVTTPAVPSGSTPRSGKAHGFTSWSKYEAGQRVAVKNADGHIRVYTYAALIAGAAPLIDVAPTINRLFTDLSFDDDGTLWLAEYAPGSLIPLNYLWQLVPTDNGYTTIMHYDIYSNNFAPQMIHAAGGYIAVGGQIQLGGFYSFDLRLLRVVNGVPQLLDTDSFVSRYYDAAPSGYAEPGQHAAPLQNVRIVPQGGKTYLFVNTQGLGDVYELGDEPRITSMSPLSGIPAGGTSVSIYGTGFAAGASVTFDGLVADSTFVSATEMTAVSPMHASGAVDVVVSPPGAAPMTAPRRFMYELTTPQSFTATATGTTSVELSWSSVPGATQYEVSRRVPAGTWDVIGTTASLSLDDGGRTAETTYVYRVRATDAAANFSDYATDLATTMSGESAVIVAGTPIVAVDLAKLRTRVNAVRAAANLPATSFTGGGVGKTVVATHIWELRSALQQARVALGFGMPALSSITLGVTPVKALHFNEILELVR